MAKATAKGGEGKAATVNKIEVGPMPGAADAVAVGLFEKTSALPGHLKELEKIAGRSIGRALALGDFKGKAGSVATVPLEGGVKRLLLVGLGKRENFDIDQLRWAAGAVAKAARGAKMKRVALSLHGEVPVQDGARVGQAIAEGILLGGFTYTEFKKAADDDKKDAPAGTVFTVVDGAGLAEGIRTGTAIGEAANYARSIACKPGNVINPTTLTEEARRLAQREKLKITVIDWEKAAKLGMGGIIGVGQGSQHPPALILLEYTGPGAAKQKPVAVVGKAVTFDTGGISIKPAPDMDAMKYDKCGGMAVLGIMQAVARLKLPVRVVGVIPTVENSVSDAAYRPGDILRLFNGKTVEVTNTDAEGRLILGDALAYAAKTYEPRAIIDMATLTGGVVIALGSVYAGLFCNDDQLRGDLEKAGRAAGELLWPLPLHERYKPLMDGYHADLVNAGGVREAHAVQGAIFLQHFVPDKTPWAHLDIAGTAAPKREDRYFAKGSNGFGVRVIVEYLRGLKA
jgi:leucyl aminopeptidase